MNMTISFISGLPIGGQQLKPILFVRDLDLTRRQGEINTTDPLDQTERLMSGFLGVLTAGTLCLIGKNKKINVQGNWQKRGIGKKRRLQG